MAYCDIDDLKAAMDEQSLIQFTDDYDTGVPNQIVIDVAMTAAAAIVDAHIAGRYGRNLSPVPEVIASLSVDISLYKLASRKSDAPKEIRTQYEDAIRLLERIAAGKADLAGVVVDEQDEAIEDTAAAVVTRDQVYTGSGIEGY